MPPTNDANEGALGSFHVLMHNQPQLTVLHYNAQRMFEQNDTQAFMHEKLTKAEDLKFIHREAQALQLEKKDKKRKEAIIVFHEKKIAEKEEATKRKQAKKDEIANHELVLDKEKIVKLTGKLFKEQLAAFKAAGAPNLDNVSTQAQVGELKEALTTAITMYKDQKWNPFKGFQKKGDEIEIFDFGTVKGEEGEDWEDIEEM